MSERPHRRLEVWKQSIVLVKNIYEISKSFPSAELYGLVSQMRRAAVSIPSNIAEGAARVSSREKLNFFRIARASLSELDTQIEICITLGYIASEEKTEIQSLMDGVGRMLNGLMASCCRHSLPPSPTHSLAHSLTRQKENLS